MTKNDFIVQCAISNMNGQFSCSERKRSADMAVEYAEKLWAELEKRGYVKDTEKTAGTF